MNERLELYLDYASIGNAHEWEDIVCQAVDELARMRREAWAALGEEHRFYYIGPDPERGQLWTRERYVLSNPGRGGGVLKFGGSDRSSERLTGSSAWTGARDRAGVCRGKRRRTS